MCLSEYTVIKFYNLEIKSTFLCIIIGRTEESGDKDRGKKDGAFAAEPVNVRTEERTQGSSEEKTATGLAGEEEGEGARDVGAAVASTTHTHTPTPLPKTATSMTKPTPTTPLTPTSTTTPTTTHTPTTTKTTTTTAAATTATTLSAAAAAVGDDAITSSNPSKPLSASMESTPKVPATVEGKRDDGKKEEGKKEDGKKEEGKKEDGKKEEGNKEGNKGVNVGESSDSDALHTPSFLPMIVCSTLVLFLSIMCALWLR